LTLSREDVVQVSNMPDLSPTVAGLGFTATDAPQIISELRSKIFDYNIKVPLNQAADLDITDAAGITLENRLKTDLTTLLGSIPAGLTKDQLKDLLNEVVTQSGSPLAREQTQLITRITTEFIERGGATRDGIWINLLASTFDIDTTRTIQRALTAMQSQKRSYQIGELLDFIEPTTTKEFIMGRLNQLKNIVQARLATDKGLNIRDINLEDRNQIKDSDIEQYAPVAFKVFKVLGVRVNPPLTPAITTAINQESTAYESALRIQIDKASIKKDIVTFNQKYWGLEGRELALAIERDFGGEMYRNDAIKYAREVEKLRKSS
ncbi:MAG TPA: hypothetical protein PLS49_05900, partial [Candidatus Woesebacteria bacterium]|nr:hypothetical protein [Candidatus Woesebacteria bacterium]